MLVVFAGVLTGIKASGPWVGHPPGGRSLCLLNGRHVQNMRVVVICHANVHRHAGHFTALLSGEKRKLASGQTKQPSKFT